MEFRIYTYGRETLQFGIINKAIVRNSFQFSNYNGKVGLDLCKPIIKRDGSN